MNKPCCVVLQLYVFKKLSRNQLWVNLLFSVSWDSNLDSRFAQESRIKNNPLSTHFWTVLHTGKTFLLPKNYRCKFFLLLLKETWISFNHDIVWQLLWGLDNHRVNRENSWNTVNVCELYIHCDVWSVNIVVHKSIFLPVKHDVSVMTGVRGWPSKSEKLLSIGFTEI